MGFCRRCGDIVAGTRCKCGGTAVAPSFKFNQITADRSSTDQPTDRWTRTYAPKELPSSQPPSSRPHSLAATKAPVVGRKFLRPVNTVPARPTLGNHVSAHIQSSVLQRPSSPLKNTAKLDDDDDPPSPPPDIIADPHTSTLSKAYGSVLQPKETLTTFTCLSCSKAFAPDATIYPDPADPATKTRFLCKPCFAANGGTKGDCAACGRPVLILTSEGGFVENAGRLWHRRCFRCDGCFKDIGDRPMVDLLGRPTCEECFDTCLKRPKRSTPKRFAGTPERSSPANNPGGMKGASREGSPAMDELHQRLGIKSREASPTIERFGPKSRESSPFASDLTQRLASISSGTPSPKFRSCDDAARGSVERYPTGRYEQFRLSKRSSPTGQSQRPRGDGTVAGLMLSKYPRTKSTPNRRSISPSSSVSASVASSYGDLFSDCSDNTTSSSSAATTPPPNSPPEHCDDIFSQSTPTKASSPRSDTTPVQLTPSTPHTPCAKCTKPLYRRRSGGRFVTVPEESAKSLPPKSYHVECFRCAVCDEPFEEAINGQTTFVRSSSGCCHVGCATPERIVIRPLSISKSPSPRSRTTDKPPKTAPPTVTSFPRFGSGATCPGCHISVSPMERGVVPGPQGSRWHASCLVCGGKGTHMSARRDPNRPGCGKRLDTAAKTDGEGGVWCMDCLLSVPDAPHSPARQSSPVRSPLTPSHTGGNFSSFPRHHEGIAPQLTGMTTIARQFTGMGRYGNISGYTGALTTQLTGGGLSPTRQLTISRAPSPTKQLGLVGGGRFPRPKSVLGARGKSVDEGRGMFLVRQMTGNGQGLEI